MSLNDFRHIFVHRNPNTQTCGFNKQSICSKDNRFLSDDFKHMKILFFCVVSFKKIRFTSIMIFYIYYYLILTKNNIQKYFNFSLFFGTHL